MPVLYRPLRQYMTPQNIAVSADETEFSLFISGIQCIAYKFTIYDLLNNVISAVSDSARVNIATKYDGEELKITKDLSTGVSAGNDYKWQIALYGNDLTVSSVNTTADIETLTISNHNLANGDMVYVSSTTSLPSPLTAYTTYYVQKLDSNTIKLHTTYEGARNNGTAINLTTAGSGTITVSSISISEQIPFSVYAKPSLIIPVSTTTFTSSKITTVEDDFEFVTGDIVTISGCENHPQNNIQAEVVSVSGKELTFASGTFVAGTETSPIKIVGSDKSYYTNTIKQYYKEIVPAYTHPQLVKPVKFVAELYDDDGGLLEMSDEKYSANIRYIFDGLLPDRTYGFRFTGVNKLNQEFDTGIVYFPVNYSPATLQTNPIASNNSENSSVVLDLNKLYQIQGEVTPDTDYEYVPNYNEFNTDIGLNLYADATLSFNGLTISPDNTYTFLWMPDDYSTFDGDIIKFENQYNSTDYLIVGYDKSLKKFYHQVNSEDKFYSAEKELLDKQIYLIAIVANNVIIVDFYSYYYGYLEDYPRYRTLIYDSNMNYLENY